MGTPLLPRMQTAWVLESGRIRTGLAWWLSVGVVLAVTTLAQAGSLTYVTNPDGTLTITGYTGIEGEVSIPAMIGDKAVTSIGSTAFAGCTTMTGITIAEGVTSIGNGAFHSCTNLASVTIPSTVISIGNEAFYSCTSLTSVVIPNGVTSINGWTFYSCTSLTSVTLGTGVTSIGWYAFSYCSSLTGITFPAGVTSIAPYSFYGCRTVGSLTLPDSVTTVGTSAFAGCLSMATLSIGNGVTTLGTGVFDSCSGLTSVTVGSGVTSLPDYTFYSCSALASIVIPDSVTSIGQYAFYSCSALASVTIGNGVASIGEAAFYNCTSLTGITLPNGTTRIEQYAFYSCSALASVVIPGSVTSVARYAFYGCSALASIAIPDGVTSIGDATFSNCPSLTSITLPNSVTSIGQYAFYCCSALASIAIPNGVTSIGDSTFYNCTSLTGITLPDSVTSIGDSAFYSCSELTNLALPDGVTSIGAHAFDYCARLTRLALPTGITGIGEYAFSHCPGLTSVTIPDSLSSIGNGVFGNCVNLASVMIGNSVTAIGVDAFRGCHNLTGITIPTTVTSIGDSAFASCTVLTRATFLGDAPSLGSTVFTGCAAGFTIYYYATATAFTSPTWHGYPSEELADTVATVTLGNLSHLYNGSARCAIATTHPAGLTVLLTYDGLTTAPVNAGTYTVVATVIDDPNHQGEATGTLHVDKRIPQVTWATPTSIAYRTALSGAQLNAMADTGGTFVYDPPVGTFLPAGTHTLRATFAPTDATNWTTAERTAQLRVNPVPATVTLDGLSQTYDGTPRTVTATTVPPGVSVSITYDGAGAAPVNAGTYAISAVVTDPSSAGSANGTLTVERAPLSVTASDASRPYGSANPAFSGVLTGVVAGDNITATYASTAGLTTAVGVYGPATAQAIVPALADPGNRLPNYTVTQTNGALTVERAPLLITANGRSKTYGQTVAFAGTEFTTSGLRNSDTVTGVTLACAGTAATATVAGAPYAIAPSAAVGTGLASYDISYANGALSVNPAPLSVAATSANRAYGAANPAFSGTLTGVAAGDTITASYASTAGAATPAGVYGPATAQAIVPALADPANRLPNYAVTQTNGTLTIDPVPLTITANSRGKTYGQAVTFAGTEFIAAGLLNADAVTSVTLSSAGAAANATVAGAPYAIVPSAAVGTGVGNYTIAYVAGSLTVSRAALSVTANAASRPYGSINPAMSGVLTGVVAADNITVTYATTALFTTPVGVYGPATPEAVTPVLADPDGRLPNYTVTQTNGTYTVERAPLTIAANSRSKTYGQTVAFAGTEFTTAGLRNGDTVTGVALACAGAAATATVAGAPYGIAPSAAVGTGLASYDITYQNGALSVNPAPLSVAAASASRAYGAANPAFGGTLTGVVAGDTITAAYASTAGPATPAGVYGPATAQAVTPALVDPANRLPNYSVTQTNGTLTIDPVPLTITANGRGKTYGQAVTFAGTEFIAAGLLNADAVTSVNLACAGAAANATVAGVPYAIVPSAAVGTGVGNYTISYIAGSLTVSRAALSVTASDASRPYGNANPAFSGVLTGGVAGDNITATYASTAGLTTAVGVYGPATAQAIVPALADPGNRLPNYTVTQTNGTLTVERAPLLITANGRMKTYGQTVAFAGTEFVAAGLRNGDTVTGVTLACAGAAANATVAGAPYAIAPSAAVGTGLASYDITYANGALSVNPAPLSVAAASASRAYGAANPAFSGTLTGVAAGDTITASYASTAGPATPAGVYGPATAQAIVPALADPANRLPNYTVTQTNGTLTIDPVPLTITANGRGKTYGQAVTFAGTEFIAAGLLNADAVTSVSLACAGAAANATVAGAPYAIVPSAAVGTGLGNYTISYVAGTLTLAKAAQVIAFDSCPLPRKAVDQAPFDLTATATSGLPATFASSAPAVATVTGATVSMVSLGTTTITASQAGDANWEPAAPVSCDLMVLAPAADFVVTEIRLDPAVPAVGSTFTALVTVQNVGPKPGNGGTLNVSLDHPALAATGALADKSATVGTLKPLQVKTIRFASLKAGALLGGRTFRAFVDAKAQTAEVDEDNNQRALAWHAGRPDFVVTAAAFAPTPPAAGKTFTASVTVKNIGESAGDAGYVDVWANAAAAVVPGLALRGNKGLAAGTLLPGQQRTLTFTSLAAATDDAEKTFRAVVDSRIKTTESDETNNQFTQSYQVGRPDFVITRIEFASDPVTCGKTFTAYVTVKNTGNAAGDAGYLEIWLNRAAAAVAGAMLRGDKSATVGPLAVAQEKQLRFTSLRASAAPEDRVFRALVDSRAKTVETDDTNNQSTKSYSCAP